MCHEPCEMCGRSAQIFVWVCAVPVAGRVRVGGGGRGARALSVKGPVSCGPGRVNVVTVICIFKSCEASHRSSQHRIL